MASGSGLNQLQTTDFGRVATINPVEVVLCESWVVNVSSLHGTLFHIFAGIQFLYAVVLSHWCSYIDHRCCGFDGYFYRNIYH